MSATRQAYNETAAANKDAEVVLQKAEAALDFAWDCAHEADAYEVYREAVTALQEAEAANHAAWIAWMGDESAEWAAPEAMGFIRSRMEDIDQGA